MVRENLMLRSVLRTWKGNSRSRGGSYNNQNGIGGYINSFGSSLKCQICRKKGHVAVNCWYRNDITSNHPSNSVIICQICGRKGHAALVCSHRSKYNLQGAKLQPELTAMTAHSANGGSCAGSTFAHGSSYVVPSVGTSSSYYSSANLRFMMPALTSDRLQVVIPIRLPSNNSGDTHIEASPGVAGEIISNSSGVTDSGDSNDSSRSIISAGINIGVVCSGGEDNFVGHSHDSPTNVQYADQVNFL